MTSFVVGLLIWVFVLGAYVLLWSLACGLVFLLSLALKSRKPIDGLTIVSAFATNLANAIIGIALLGYGLGLLLGGHWLVLIVYVAFGAGLAATIFSLIPAVFLAVPAYLTDHYDRAAREGDVIRAELLDADHRVIQVIEGDGVLNRRLAIYFLLTFAINAASLLEPHRAGAAASTWLSWLILPTLWTVEESLVIGLVLGFFNLVVHHQFFYRSARHVLILALQLSFAIIFAAMTLVLLLHVTGNA